MQLDPERKLAQLSAALDQSLVDLATRAKRARAGIGFRSLSPYYDYRSALDEHLAIVAVIDNTIRQLENKQRAKPKERLLESERQMLALTIRAALDFFFALSAIPVLPIGIRECFAQELQSLHNAQARLHVPEHEGKLSGDLAGDLEIAEEILAEIMAKAPSLMNFGK